MAEEYGFPPYGEEMLKVLEKFGGTKMETYKGKDIRPLWDLKGRADSVELQVSLLGTEA